MVANEDSGARRSQDIVGIFDDEVDAGGEAHNIVEGASGGPLGDLSLTDACENNRGEDSVEGDNEKGDVGGERAGHEGRLGEDEGQHEEADGENKVSSQEVDEVLGEKVHGLVLFVILDRAGRGEGPLVSFWGGGRSWDLFDLRGSLDQVSNYVVVGGCRGRCGGL